MKCHSCKSSGQSTPQLLHARTNTSECWNLHGCIVRKHIFRDLCFNWKYKIIFGSLWNCRGKIIHGNTGVVYEEACFAHNHWLLYESYHLQSIDVHRMSGWDLLSGSGFLIFYMACGLFFLREVRSPRPPMFVIGHLAPTPPLLCEHAYN